MNRLGQQADSVSATDQFRVTRLQVFNWGTFDGLHDMRISEKGFLVVGRSGSGKTTLLDAISALLVPPKWIDFNAAARDTARRGSDRNWVSYVRGAWAEQKEDSSGEIVTRYLRKGPTWSALAVTYRNARDRAITLVELLWIRGSSTAVADVKRHYAVFERALDLHELKDFDLNVRRLKQSHPDGAFFENFEPYRERFGRLLGIEKELALRLLHKTQSAKNLGDLNTFLRDFMLDPPATFEAGQRFVTEFAELSEAHQAVVTARQQVEVLKPARQQYERLQSVLAETATLEHLQQGIDPYRETVRGRLLESRLEELRVQIEGLNGQQEQQQASVENNRSALRDLEDRHRTLGGERIEQLEAEQRQKEKQRTGRVLKRAQVLDACNQLDWPMPNSPDEFAQLVGKARQELDQWQEQMRLAKEERDKKVLKRCELEGELRDIAEEVQSLRRQPSNIPRRMLELRDYVAEKLGLSADVLPFVGELVEVLLDDAAWRGAIERVLHGFALSILAEERHYAALSTLVNEEHLGNRLVYYRTTRSAPAGAISVPLNSLVRKLKIKEGTNHDWLVAELRSRFDYACVDSVRALRETQRGVTRQGQIRHSQHRHEKDDRRRVDDRVNWVLGFDNRGKLALYEKRGQELTERLAALNRDITAMERCDEERNNRALLCQTLANLRWDELDVVPVVERLAAIQRELEAIRAGNESLSRVAKEIEEQRKRLKAADEALRDIQVQHREAERDEQRAVASLEKTKKALAETPLSPAQAVGLAPRFEQFVHTMTLENLGEQSQQVERRIAAEIRALAEERNRVEKGIELRFAEFKRQWPAESADLDGTLASAPDFLAKLKRLEVDGLPKHEHRFFELLREQSNQNLASLNTLLRQARTEIRERMDLVNEGLKRADFNEGTHLCIDVTDRLLLEVQEFRREVHEALSHAWSEDRELAERRFTVLKRLVERLASEDPDARRWREAVLDVRQHVEFIARELDTNGGEIEVYRSGAGKSGGQREKLATTCMAAALKYQLGGTEQDLPTYATVVLDEAFGKGDHDYTKMAMEIFRKLGFQMIVATPLKSVMTLEPFIGGACFVDINDRQKSGLLLIEYDEEAKRLNLPEQACVESPVEVP